MTKAPVCSSGKEGYHNEDRAVRALGRLTAKFGDQGALHPYACECGGWHLGRSGSGHASWAKRWTRKVQAGARAHCVWFLDADGTLAPLGQQLRRSGDDGWDVLRVGAGPEAEVRFRPTILQQIADLQARGLVEVRWLTSTSAVRIAAWEERGLGTLRVARPVEQGRRRSWKSNVVEQWMIMNPGRRVIWTDDELTPGRLRGFDRSRILAIAPDSAYGLSDRHMTRIERWLTSTSGS